ncbi:alpha/beta hydrolase family protein [Alloactinosynnema sp. L-07]|uniref:alpha/beta hydrolase n=1 Tax=Alloactinosynnema sp. L-07 TaxID=1653480 RepID=UPI0006B5FF7E|nr:alpha/beta hydrolase-fold protein [Alloactinosynnema sp. L-07]
MPSESSPTRRAVLTAAAAGLCSVAGLGVFGYWLLRKELPPAPPADSVTPTPGTTTKPKPPKPVVAQQVQSAARGRAVELVIMRPEGVDQLDLPVCLALHGRGNSAQMFVELGVPAMLTAAVAAGVPPFAVAALDGGDSYWVAADPADDPQRMLVEEVPGWLTAAGLRPTPAAVMGISMGAYGALNYARSNPGLGAVVAISPALFATWNDARSRAVFSGRPQWEATEPLRHTEKLKKDTLAVWCGASDPFAPVARQLIAKVKPASAVVGPGAHDAAYWQKVLPDVLGFVGSHL